MKGFCFLSVLFLLCGACARQAARGEDSPAPLRPTQGRVLAEVKKLGVPRISQERDAILVDLELVSPEGAWRREVEIEAMETGFVVRVWLNPLGEAEAFGAVSSCWTEEVRIPVSRTGGFDIEVEGKNGKQMDIVFVD